VVVRKRGLQIEPWQRERSIDIGFDSARDFFGKYISGWGIKNDGNTVYYDLSGSLASGSISPGSIQI
jgi:hypothetical protein